MTMWDNFLDKTIFFSFDKSGFIRHKKYFTEDLFTKDISSKTCLVTGGTSGIGEEVATALSSLNSRVIVTGRNEKKGIDFVAKNPNSGFVSLDMVEWDELEEFCKSSESFDYIVLNAGSMPEDLILNKAKVEFQCASQLVGHFKLIKGLKKYNKLKTNARIVWVSSGGMYLKELDLDTLFYNDKYEKVAAYANVKRAQVTLVEELAKITEWSPYSMLAMHPGWVGTDGLRVSLPKFSKFMKNRLRNSTEGADTILWLLLTDSKLASGAFYFDRKSVTPYLSNKYIPSLAERKLLLEKLNLY